MSKVVESSGFGSLWISEDYYFRDAVSTLSSAAVVTKRIKLGTGVLNPYTRNPALLAMTLAAMDEISNGRLIFGIGPGTLYKIHDQMGITRTSPRLSVKECVQVVRQMLTSTKTTYEGKTIKITNVSLGFQPIRKELPIYIGAIGPRMLRLAGEIADGVLLTMLSSEDYARYALEKVKEGVNHVGRNPRDVSAACLVLLSIDKNPDAAAQAVKREIVFQLSPPRIGEFLFEKSGLDQTILKNIRAYFLKGKVDEACRYVTREVVETLTVCGTVDECADKLERYAKAGLDMIVATPVHPNISEIAALGDSLGLTSR